MLFAKEGNEKVYFDDEGNIVKEGTDWLEIPVSVNVDVAEAFERATERKVKVKNQNVYEISTYSKNQKNCAFLVKVIKAWSSDMPITEPNVHKLDSRVYRNFYEYVVKKYQLLGQNQTLEKGTDESNEED